MPRRRMLELDTAAPSKSVRHHAIPKEGCLLELKEKIMTMIRRQEARVAINLRERNDYYTPSQSLFCDHCEHVALRYSLKSDLIRKDTLTNLDYGTVRGVSVDDQPVFTVETPTKRFYSKAVVLAVGPANEPEIPRMPSMPADLHNLRQACHSLQIKTFPDPVVQQRMAAGKATNVLIVGGGLTSAQLTDLAIRKGVTKVWHIMRGPCRVKHFDVDLEWMGKYKNTEQARFWLADSDEERLEIIKSARGGGSFTPLFYKRLKKHIASGRLELHEKTSLLDSKFEQTDEETGMWTVKTDPPLDMPSFDYIYFATGVQTSVSNLPYLQKIHDKYPISTIGGFPCINEDLMWTKDVPLYCVGRLSALQLGPAAPNIGGAKVGAERVAWSIEDTIRPSGWREDEDAPRQHGGMTGYLSGHENMYNALAIEAS